MSSKKFRKIHRKTLVVPEPDACNFIEIETLAQVFACEFWEISKNTSELAYVRTMFSFYTYWKHKTSRFLIFSGVTETERWSERYSSVTNFCAAVLQKQSPGGVL